MNSKEVYKQKIEAELKRVQPQLAEFEAPRKVLQPMLWSNVPSRSTISNKKLTPRVPNWKSEARPTRKD